MKCWGVYPKNFFPHEGKIKTSRGSKEQVLNHLAFYELRARLKIFMKISKPASFKRRAY